jgi:hypothetical protein
VAVGRTADQTEEPGNGAVALKLLIKVGHLRAPADDICMAIVILL